MRPGQQSSWPPARAKAFDDADARSDEEVAAAFSLSRVARTPLTEMTPSATSAKRSGALSRRKLYSGNRNVFR